MRDPDYYVGVVVIVVSVPLLVYVLDPTTPPLFSPPLSPPPPPPTSPSISYLYMGSAKHIMTEEDLHRSLDGAAAAQASLSLDPNSPSPSYSQPQTNDENLLLPKRQTWSGLGTRRKECNKLCKVEAGLARARGAIREASLYVNPTSSALPDPDYVPQGPIYRNARAFHRSYLEMEKVFRIFVYEEGEPPLFHDGPCKSIYSTEGRFIHDMEMETKLRTRSPDHAYAYLLPFSITKMVGYLYQHESFDLNPVKRTIADYIGMISRRYPYWNQSLGADHLILSCHDWGPHASAAVPYLYHNSIRVLCNANSSEGFNPAKDATLPEINLVTGNATNFIGGPSPSSRSVLGFFAGGVHGPIRPVLLKHWKDKDGDLRVSEYLPKNISYHEMMKKSKFCICPSGYEVASPRIVEAIYAECVPVIISDGYVLPFSDVLNWKAFSVQVSVSDIPNLKNILLGISQQQYIRMQKRVKQVQKHFVVNSPPKRFDVFHMVLHSIWLRRLNVRVGQNV